jgi:hypothetical protein
MVLIDTSLKGINFENEKLYGHYLYTYTQIKKVDEG